jgi:hypothetical protein
MIKCNDEIYQLAKDQALVKKLKNKRFRPFCLCLPDVMFVTRGFKSSLFFVFDFRSNLDCGQWYKFWICQSHHGHSSDLTKKTLLPVSQHFVSPGHSLDDFGRSKIYIIDHNPNWKENQRQKRESFWIRELQTLHPEGINKKA